MQYIEAAELTYTKVRALDMSRTICFQPVSALEVHGPHLPLGMDFYMARWMAEQTGRRFATAHPDWTVVQQPPLPLGTDELPLAGSMNASQRTVYGALIAHGRSLAKAGYRYIVLTNGHGGPRHASAIEHACRKISKRHGVSMFSPSALALHRIVTGQRFAPVEEFLGRALTDGEKHGLVNGEHAGSWETSFMLAQNPELVESNWRELKLDKPPVFKPLAKIGEVLINRRKRRGGDAAKLEELFDGIGGGIGWLLNAHYGYGGPTVSYQGDPSVASAEIGHAFREVMARDCLELVEDVTSGRQRATDVRSIASDHLPIQPWFGAKLALAAALLLILARVL
ncbi:MAG TPA: creatininase family protein [Candidatus Acidoferrales bacterium]|nr:creatininase family protein [Candidatus Acidoferrales bacterium]